MYNQLKTLMPQADIFYGPVTKEEAFNVSMHSFATPVGNDWYIGVNSALSGYENKIIEKPPEPEISTEQPTE